MSLREIYSLKIEPYLDTIRNKYIKILTISDYPKGELSRIVRQVRREKLSDKQVIDDNERCIFSLMSLRSEGNFMTLSEIPKLYAFLNNNSYSVNNVEFAWEKDTICFIEYFY